MRTPDDRDPNSDNQISGARENESPPLQTKNLNYTNPDNKHSPLSINGSVDLV
jgi:hypothetical protein